MYILPYRRYSQSVQVLKDNLNIKSIKLEGSKWKPADNKIVINWGNSNPPVPIGNNVLNRPEAVLSATDKLTTLHVLYSWGIMCPEFTSDIEVARSWFDNNNKIVVFCRTKLRSSGGEGIVIAKSKDQLVPAPLYTKNVSKAAEYRVHVFKDKVIDVAQKKLRNGVKDQAGRNKYIRNVENGWIFAHENVVCPEEVQFEAVKAVAVLRLDFGAVDIAINKDGQPFVFEVNTAPGIENNKTIKAYVDEFTQYKNNKNQNRQLFGNNQGIF